MVVLLLARCFVLVADALASEHGINSLSTAIAIPYPRHIGGACAIEVSFSHDHAAMRFVTI